MFFYVNRTSLLWRPSATRRCFYRLVVLSLRKHRHLVYITQVFDLLGCTFKRISNYGYNKALTVRPPTFNGAELLTQPYYDETVTNGIKHTFVLVTISKEKLKAVRSNYKEVFRHYRGFNIGRLIEAMNPKDKGFPLSARTVDCSKVFRHLDDYVFRLLLRLFRREHGAKSWTWIRARYFRHIRIPGLNSSWVLSDPSSDLTLLPTDIFPR